MSRPSRINPAMSRLGRVNPARSRLSRVNPAMSRLSRVNPAMSRLSAGSAKQAGERLNDAGKAGRVSPGRLLYCPLILCELRAQH